MSSDFTQLALLPSTETQFINPPQGAKSGNRRPTKFHADICCDGPGCDVIIPAGFVPSGQRYYFHSDVCKESHHVQHLPVIGKCEWCDGDIKGKLSEAGQKKYCSMKCYGSARDKISGAGPFQSDLQQYLSLAKSYGYAPKSIPSVRVVLCRFFDFVVNTEKMTKLEDIRSSTVTRFIASERARGIKGNNHVGYLSAMFSRWIDEEKVDMVNPVISRIHSHREPTPDPRPYEDKALSSIRLIVESEGGLVLSLAMAIGEECGLRIGEVCNIRLSDIDRDKQSIFVRLPTKNKRRTRTVPFHDKVNKYLDLWLPLRNPRCSHDNLLHGKLRAFYKTASLDEKFAKLLSRYPEPASSFLFHRLRHTWATRLMNNGMELAVLKELGGWVSWSSMQIYIRVLDSTVRAQYQAAYHKLQEPQESGQEDTLSLLDFALMDAAQTSNHTNPAV